MLKSLMTFCVSMHMWHLFYDVDLLFYSKQYYIFTR